MGIKYTNQEFVSAVENSLTIAEVLRKLGLKPMGTNYKTVKNTVIKLGLDISHYTGKSHGKSRSLGPKK